MRPPRPELVPRNHKVARPTPPNKGVEVAYRKALLRLIDGMQNSVMYWIRAEYKKYLPQVLAYDAVAPWWRKAVGRLLPALDASPARGMERALRRRMLQWRRDFDREARRLGRRFVRQASAASTAALGSSLAQISGITVDFQTTRAVNNALQSLIIENVNLIKSIPVKYFTELEGLVMRSVRAGRDLGYLTDEIEQRYGVTRRRAEFISRDQNNKATSAISRIRQQELGITQAVWIHSGRGKHPRPLHRKANGKIYNLAQGCLIGGRYIHPGEDPNCGCTSAPVIPAFAQSQRDLLREEA